MKNGAAQLMLAGALAMAVSGCINWQAGYDNAARTECQSDPDDGARRACLDRVDANARAQREAARHGE